MLHATPLDAPEDVAWFLASYAREAKARIEGIQLSALATIRSALEEALGGIEGLDYMTSRSEAENSIVKLNFRVDRDIDLAVHGDGIVQLVLL